MNISPISFKGLITVTTATNSGVKTEEYRTTKKQDGEILAAFVKNNESIRDYQNETTHNQKSLGYGNLDNVYGKHTKLFHETLESIIGKEIKQPSLGDSKELLMGGQTKQSYSFSNYDSSYNKIYYYDSTIKKPSSKVVVDLMEPEERKEAAVQSYVDISNIVDGMTNNFDERFYSEPTFNQKSEGDFAKIETGLNSVLRALTGESALSLLLKDAPEFETKTETYNTFVEKLNKFMGNDPIVKEGPKEVNLSSKDNDKLRAAIHLLENMMK